MNPQRKPAYQALDELYLAEARRIARFTESIRCSTLSQTWTDLIFANTTAFNSINTFTSETSLLQSTPSEQPWFPAGFFDGYRGVGKTIRIEAMGVLSSTGTPTYQWQLRFGTTTGADTGGASLGVTAAATTGSGVTNKFWYLLWLGTVTAPGIGSNKASITGAGFVTSPNGLATPFTYPLETTTPESATWPITFDASVNNYISLNAVCSSSSGSNAVQCINLLVMGLN